MGVEDPRSRDPSAWPARSNRLGIALMKARERILAEEEDSAKAGLGDRNGGAPGGSGD
jgi:hypothetical protein